MPIIPYFCKSRSPRGERGLKQTVKLGTGIVGGRSPRGERGLKPSKYWQSDANISRSPRGERGLKQQTIITIK